MAELITLARPYAKAVFDLASEQKLQAEWARILTCLSLTAKNPHVARLIGDPTIEDTRLIELFNEVCDVVLTEQDNKLNKQRYQFVCLLTGEDRLNLLPQIAVLFHNMQAEQEGLVEADVTSAYPLSEAERASLQKKLANYFASKIELNFREDSDLIGGFVIRAGNWVMDASIKGKLTKLT